MKFSSRFHQAALAAFCAFPVLFLTACGAPRQMSEEEKYRLANCKPVESYRSYQETPYVGSQDIVHTYQNLRATLNSACASCHLSPAKSGGFTYIDTYRAQEISLGGKLTWVDGFFETAEKMRESIFHADPSKQMPPADRRAKNPEAFLKMGRELEIWIQAGKPEGNFKAGTGPKVLTGKPRPVKPMSSSELGDCVPVAGIVGFDYEMDRFFENATELPKHLSETDMTSLDPLALARTGTFAYNVEYPLWADNAEKGRWLHVPWKLENGRLVKQSIRYNPETKNFDIPENTRFYKSFYRAITMPDGKIRMRRMETRLIVARTPSDKSLFGTYQWDETEQVATLVTAPYRDGTPWKDLVYAVPIDEVKGKFRDYAIPGRQRCIDCHVGSPSKNFILGFQPLQINKRAFGEAGRLDPALSSDLSQVQRFLEYGVISGIKSPADLPRLEDSGNMPARNVYELRANGYTVGNCFHCHNPDGIAFNKDNGVRLGLGPGELFSFNTQLKSVQQPQRRMVHQNGELDSSHIWRKVADPPTAQGIYSQMPMHTPGAPDCRVLEVMGRWIRSFESLQAAETWENNCKPSSTLHWIDMDLTWPSGETFMPRRNDWKDPVEGMPQKYRDIQLTENLRQAITTEYPVGYWLKRPACEFPKTDLPPEKRLPWMMKGTQPKRPYGEIYYASPGAHFFKNTCAKCHGPKGDGDSPLARSILNWSGGGVRVANFMEGMFGNKNENLKTFDIDGVNYGGQYLIWMAMEGTRVKFPPEVASAMGKHGGQMLNGIREKCLSQISIEKASSPNFMDHEIFRAVCFMENLYAGHPDLEFDPASGQPRHPERVEAWLDRAAWNAGWAIYEYLKEMASGTVRPNNDQCEMVYKKGGT
ncbi:MAG: hypothetical protein KF767_01495 [Bdellovibrionaceae bacterium]|nr:hypothetical protein [Pseudobdellovibrionaceae bacterium]